MRGRSLPEGANVDCGPQVSDTGVKAMEQIDQRGLLIIAAALCGMAMVIGAFVLLYRGIIKFEPPSNAQPTELEVFKIVKLKTNIAALVLFVLGLAFLMIGFQNISPPPPEFNLAGRITGIGSDRTPSVMVLVCGGPWQGQVHTDGSFYFPIKPDLDTYGVMVGVVGGQLGQHTRVGKVKPTGPTYGFVPIDKDGVARVGDIRMNEGDVSVRVPQPEDRVSGKPVPAVRYGSP
jgi:hypothetical protein